MKVATSIAGLLASAFMASAHAGPILAEGFDDVSTLPASGWVQTNLSVPLGSTSWFQGNSAAFASQAGAPNAYVAANFLNTSPLGGVIDDWLISPELSLGGGATLTFYTRTADPGFDDLLEVRFSSGSGTAASGFTTLLLTVDSSTPYPDSDWQLFSVTLPSAVSGRFAFHYSVADGTTADYIGIDTVNVAAAAIPEPSSYVLMGLGLVGLALYRRRGASV